MIHEKNELFLCKSLAKLIMNIALHHFRLVDTISKEGSLTKAASALRLTQSALSHQLKELEKELDIEVFHRQGKKLQLTEVGYRFLRSSEKILAEIRTLQEDISYYKNGKTGQLNISMQCYTAYHWLPGVIKDFKSQWPDININIVSDASRRPLEYLMRGDLDLGIVRTQMVNTLIQYDKVFEDQLVVMMSADHPLSAKEVIEFTDFQDEELILAMYDPSYQDTPLFDAMMAELQVKPKHWHRIHYSDATVDMVTANLGIAVMSDMVIKPYLQGRNIVCRPLPPIIAKRPWYAATKQQTPALQSFLCCLKKHFANEGEAAELDAVG
jgi:LysR family transcriptional regulator for metE and metH